MKFNCSINIKIELRSKPRNVNFAYFVTMAILGVKWSPSKSELKKAREDAEKAGDWGTASKGSEFFF